MIQITVLPNALRVLIPTEMKSEAPRQLKAIWRDEFDSKSDFILELTDPVKEFVEKAKLNCHILVYH